MELEHRLYRSRHQRVIAGVCGGIAEYFDIDPTIVRLIAVVTAFLNGIGIVVYLLAWLVLPETPSDAEVHLPRNRGPRPPRAPGGRPAGRGGKPRAPIQFPGPRRKQDQESPAEDDAPPEPESKEEDKV